MPKEMKALSEEQRELLTNHVNLVQMIVRKMRSRLPKFVELEDLLQEGWLGLIDAVQKYKPELCDNFEIYARNRIKGSVFDYLRKLDLVSRTVRSRIKQLDKVVTELQGKLGHPPSEKEIAKELKISIDEYRQLVEHAKPVVVLSIDKEYDTGNYEKVTMKQTIADQTESSTYSVLHKKNKQEVLTWAVKKLAMREQTILDLYYNQELTMKEIGQVLDLTESRISQLHNQAILQLKSIVKQKQV